MRVKRKHGHPRLSRSFARCPEMTRGASSVAPRGITSGSRPPPPTRRRRDIVRRRPPLRAPTRPAIVVASSEEAARVTRASKVAGPSPDVGGSLFVFGLGYVSLGLVSTLKRAGWRVGGTCRSADRAASLRSAGVEAFEWRPDDGKGLTRDGMNALMTATHVLNSVPPVGDFDEDPVLADEACADALVAAAAASSPGKFPANSRPRPAPAAGAAATLRWVGYLSSTGVYGDKGGGWVDEDTVPAPVSPKGVARYAAEEAWREMFDKHGVPVVVFRLGGIYGPGRSILDTVAKQAAATKANPGVGTESRSQRARDSRKFTSRCHVGDIVAVLCADIAKVAEEAAVTAPPAAMRVYNVVDDEPAPRAEAAAYARRLLNIETDGEDAAAGTDAVDGKNAESTRGEKRVRNDKIKSELGVHLLYPTYREGLAAIAEGDKTPFE